MMSHKEAAGRATRLTDWGIKVLQFARDNGEPWSIHAAMQNWKERYEALLTERGEAKELSPAVLLPLMLADRFALSCPSCVIGSNCKGAGGSEKCFHCDTCGWVECVWSSPAHEIDASCVVHELHPYELPSCSACGALMRPLLATKGGRTQAVAKVQVAMNEAIERGRHDDVTAARALIAELFVYKCGSCGAETGCVIRPAP